MIFEPQISCFAMFADRGPFKTYSHYGAAWSQHMCYPNSPYSCTPWPTKNPETLILDPMMSHKSAEPPTHSVSQTSDWSEDEAEALSLPLLHQNLLR